MHLTELKLRAARAAFADRASPPALEHRLGDVALRPHQLRALELVRAQIARHGGCLLAEDVGRGKTFIALALAQRHRAPLVVIPAALRDSWTLAMRRSDVACTLVTHEALSRGSIVSPSHDLVIVDESHHFRTLATRRYAALAVIAARAPVLLLSATPLQNRDRDLAAQLALFLGSSALARPAAELATHVVRSASTSDDFLPASAPPRWITAGADDGTVLRALLALPPPPRALDAGDAGALRAISLVRAWASSRAALVSALSTRRRIAVALEQSAAAGRIPFRRELRGWPGSDDSVQLGLVPFLAPSALPGPAADALHRAAGAELRALDRLRRMLRETPDPDIARADALRETVTRHHGRSILAFSEMASTVRSYFARLRSIGGVGMLTSHESRIGSGSIPRRELLALFAPSAQGAVPPHARERVTLLITTDLLAEGLNLQDASVVVHLDLPWNPARLAQRVGRVRRPGGAAEVFTYLVAPPARATVLLAVEARLRRKLRRAERVIGATSDVLPVLAPGSCEAALHPARAEPPLGAAQLENDIARLRAGWSRAASSRVCSRPIVAATEAPFDGYLVALAGGGMLASRGGRIARSARARHVLLLAAGGTASPVSPRQAGAVLRAARRALDREQLVRACGVGVPGTPVAGTIASLLQRGPRHDRAACAMLAHELRSTLASGIPLGAERALDSLARARPAESGDAGRILREALAIVRAAPSRVDPSAGERPGPDSIRAVIVLRPARHPASPAEPGSPRGSCTMRLRP